MVTSCSAEGGSSSDGKYRGTVTQSSQRQRTQRSPREEKKELRRVGQGSNAEDRKPLNKQFVFLFHTFALRAAVAAAPRTKHIQPDLDSLHHRRSFLHRAPEIALELHPHIFHGFQRAGQDAVGA